MRTAIWTMLACLCGLCVVGCTTAPKTERERDTLHADVQDTVEMFTRLDPGLQGFLDKAHGYAVFPTVGRAGLIAGGAYGKGEVFEKGEMVGYCDMTQATIGAQIGGQAFSEMIVFETERAMEKFKANQLAFTAQATAVILKSGAAANARYADGVAIFTQERGGAMAEAAVGGQQFTYKPK
jgi:lipid-binding SYLF domain-containing protein